MSPRASPDRRSSASSRSYRGSSPTPARPKPRDRAALRHHRRTARRRSRARVDDRRPAVLARRLSRRREDEDGHVSIRLADYFRRPLRLTPAEGLALLAAGRALLAVPGSDPDGPLATALDEARGRARAPGLVVDVGEPGQLAAIRDAVATHAARRDRVLVGRPRRADDAAHRSRGRVLRDRRVVRRRVLPPRARRAHVPRRPHPLGRADRGALRAGRDRVRDRRRVHAPRRRHPRHPRARARRRRGSRRPTRPRRSPSAPTARSRSSSRSASRPGSSGCCCASVRTPGPSRPPVSSALAADAARRILRRYGERPMAADRPARGPT